jgi:MSHA biogenesis protein MshL
VSHYRVLVLVLALAPSLSCAGLGWLVPPAVREPPPPDAVEQALDHALEHAEADPAGALPPAVSDALLPPLRLEPVPKGTAQRFDVSVTDMPVREFLLGLVADTDLNLALDPGLSGTITLTLKNVTIVEVLSALRDVYGYSYEKTGYGWHVHDAGLQTRIFAIDYPMVRRTGQSQTRVSSGQVSERVTGDDDDTDVLRPSEDVSGSMISTASQSDFWVELEAGLWAILGKSDGRSVVSSPNSGIVVVRALPAELREVERFLRRAQASLGRQVILEAKILEVTLDDGFQSGINWALLLNDALIGQTGGGTAIADGVSEIAGNTGVLDPDNLAFPSNTDTSAFSGVWSAAIDWNDFTAFIELIETQGSVRTLSSPRVATTNNQKAVIKVGSDEFFVTDISTTTVTSTTTTTTPDITLTPFFSGIALDVTPQISERGEIILHIHPSISQVTDQTKTVSVGGVDQTLPLALSTIREADSVVRAWSGQVIVLGGLMQDLQSHDKAGTPWLGRLPWLGAFFRHQLDGTRRTELVILLRASAVGPGTWTQELRDVRDRVRAVHDRPPAPAAAEPSGETGR